jgi:hypothetical protein
VSDTLGLTLVAAGQSAADVTINDATNALANSQNRVLAVAMADANVTLTTAQAWRHGLLRATGANTAVRKLILPAGARQIAVRNQTTGGHAVEVGYSTGAVVRVPPGGQMIVYGDGTDCYGVSNGITLAGLVPGAYGASAPLMRFIVTVPFTLPAGLGGSFCRSLVAADASASLPITRNGSSVGDFTFAGAATTATVSFASAVAFAQGDVLGLDAPTAQDATLEGVHWSIRGSLI